MERAKVAEVTLEGSRLAVCRCGHFTSYAVRPFATALGARQPVLPNRETLQGLLEQLPTEERCALGPIRFYQGWEQADGSILFDIKDFPLAEVYRNPLCNQALSTLAAHQGKLLHATAVTAILLEY